MKKIITILSILILFNVNYVEAKTIPDKGNFECHYMVPYENPSDKRKGEFELIITRENSAVSTKQNSNLKIELKDDITLIKDGGDYSITDSPATWYNHASDLGNTIWAANTPRIDSSKLTIQNFVDDKGLWSCPNIYSVVAMTCSNENNAQWWGVTIASVKFNDISTCGISYESTLTKMLSSKNKLDNSNPNQTTDINRCEYYMDNDDYSFVGISYDNKNYTFTTDMPGADKNALSTFEMPEGKCLSIDKMGLCASDVDHSWYLTSDKTCKENFVYYGFKDLSPTDILEDDKVGVDYRKHICELKSKLQKFTLKENLRKTSSLAMYKGSIVGLDKEYNILDLPCNSWGTEFNFECSDEECLSNLEYTVNKKVGDVLLYCNDVYKTVLDKNTYGDFKANRYEECKSFEGFYNSLVENGIINNLLEKCNIFSGEMKDKLNYILNIIKIAGPILAVLLGMLDFVKVLASGDADKEMKTAWNNFKIRLFAAFLLFLVPILLSMLINIFIGDEINNNPYCGLLTSEDKEIK